MPDCGCPIYFELVSNVELSRNLCNHWRIEFRNSVAKYLPIAGLGFSWHIANTPAIFGSEQEFVESQRFG